MAQGMDNGEAKLQTLKYRVVRANKSYCGEIDVGVTFNLKVFFTIFSSVNVNVYVTDVTFL